MADGHRDLTVNAIGVQHYGHCHKLVSTKTYKEHSRTLSIVSGGLTDSTVIPLNYLSTFFSL